MACRLEEEGEELFLNCVGTYGIGCAGYWGSRLFGVFCRISLAVSGRRPLWQLLFADDVLWSSKGIDGIRSSVLCLFIMVFLGVRCSWSKVHGGFTFTWVGMEICLVDHSLGLSEARAAWLVNWIGEALRTKGVYIRDLVSVLGRLSFAAGPLERIRPFLAPLFAWTSVVPGHAFLAPSPDVSLCLSWTLRRLSRGGRLEKCRPQPVHQGILFRSDAKAEDGAVIIGGWECRDGGVPATARWYSVRLDQDNAPWLYCRGEPFRVLAALELMDTLVSVMVFMGPGDEVDGAIGISVAGATNIKGNTDAVQRIMSNSFPLSAFLWS